MYSDAPEINVATIPERSVYWKMSAHRVQSSISRVKFILAGLLSRKTHLPIAKNMEPIYQSFSSLFGLHATPLNYDRDGGADSS